MSLVTVVTNEKCMLIDVSYFIFHRFYAIMNWYSKYSSLNEVENIDSSNITEDPVFMNKYETTFHKNIASLAKKFGVNPKNIFLAKDCPRDAIWRNEHMEAYKGMRDDKKLTFDRNIFKKTYEEIVSQYNTLYHPHLEADDVIAVTVNTLVKKYKQEEDIIIITNDNDFVQLAVHENVKVFNLHGKDLVQKVNQDPASYLKCKIIMGDKSDNIPCIFPKIGPVTAKKLCNNSDSLDQVLLNPEAKKQWILNGILIDFKNIPSNYSKEFIANIKFSKTF